MTTRHTQLSVLVLAALVLAAPARAGDDWNDGGIAWQPYEAGLALAKKEKKPICLIFFTESCQHCSDYSKVFHDPGVVAKSKDFVMTRVEVNSENTELALKYAPDGQYVPRTLFLSPSNELWADVHAPRETYKYFYQFDPKSTLDGMDAALAKLNTDHKIAVDIPLATGERK